MLHLLLVPPLVRTISTKGKHLKSHLSDLGIGRATAKLFAKEGCRRIVVADIRASALNETREEIQAEYKDAVVTAIPTGQNSYG